MAPVAETDEADADRPVHLERHAGHGLLTPAPGRGVLCVGGGRGGGARRGRRGGGGGARAESGGDTGDEGSSHEGAA
ncbi:hypothetical protein SGLAM104S_01184 [Streptomyces glaucescens]